MNFYLKIGRAPISVSSLECPVYESRGESGALGHSSVSIFFGQVDNKEPKNEYSSIVV